MNQKRAKVRAPVVLLGALALPAVLAGACSANGNHTGFTTASAAVTSSGTGLGGGGGGGGGTNNSSGDGINFEGGLSDAPACSVTCSADLHSVVDCLGNVQQTCTGSNGCDHDAGTCANACQATVNNKLSVGCEYYATFMDTYEPGVCFAAFVGNTWNTPVHLTVDFAGNPLSPASFAWVNGAPYDATAGLPPGEVAILFLAGSPGGAVPCPHATAMPSGAQVVNATGVGHSFHITTDVPVVMYEINPYGGGSAAITGASLLLPTSVWDTNYVAVTASTYDIAPPSMNVIAAEDGTSITMLPSVAVSGGGALPAGAANVQYTFTLNKGQQAQFTQNGDLTGSVIQSTKPIGFMAGQQCMRIPFGVAYCDHGEQMVPPIKALGNEYVGVMYRPRVPGDAAIWHLVGVVDDTALTYSPSTPTGAPLTLGAGQVVDFTSSVPFVVQSQDTMHPFMLFTYMSGSQWTMLSNTGGYGDADFVLSVPPQQYNTDYVFYTDTTYPETNLVVIRAPDETMAFDDVTLDCAGVLTGWTAVGNYEWTRVDVQKNFAAVNGCTNGAHEIKSKGPFGLWVWGWGTPVTAQFTGSVSYGYPAGMNVRSINTVVIPPMPK